MAIIGNNSETALQIATCKSAKELKVKGELRKVFKFDLEGKQFDVWETKDFVPEVGGKYRPIVDVSPTVYYDKDGRPRATEKCFVNWKKV